MQAIVTKYLPATIVKGSRVKASCAAKSIIRSWDYSLNADQNHRAVAKELVTLMGWNGDWIGGWLPDGERSVWICADARNDERFSVDDTSPHYTLDAGRCLVKDGKPLATLHGVGEYDPCEIDALARKIVSRL